MSKASNINNLRDNCKKEMLSEGDKEAKWFKTCFGSQVMLFLGRAGLAENTPFKNFEISQWVEGSDCCVQTAIKALIADFAVLILL